MKVKAKKEIHDHVFDDFENQNLEPCNIYNVIGIDYDCFRVINEKGEPILYPKCLFEIIDSSIPESWIRTEYGPDEYYIDPPELSPPGFYEDLFDNVPQAIKVYEKLLVSMCIKNTPRK